MAASYEGQTAQVFVVLISWNRREDTLACLRSLDRVDWPHLTVVVIDNGSSDGSANAISAEHPAVELVQNTRNLGFAEAANIGMRHALAMGADAVMLLNNDMVVEAGFLEPLLKAVEADPGVGAVCSQILFADLPDLVWYAGASVRIERGHHGRNTGYGGPPIAGATPPYRTDCACGGAMLIPREMLEIVGFLDASLFAYREDLDWSLRAREQGRHILVVPASVVRHEVSASSGGASSPTSLYYDTRNGLVVAERHAPLGRLRTTLRRTESLAAHAAQALLSRDRRAGLRAVFDGWRDVGRARLGERPR